MTRYAVIAFRGNNANFKLWLENMRRIMLCEGIDKRRKS